MQPAVAPGSVLSPRLTGTAAAEEAARVEKQNRLNKLKETRPDAPTVRVAFHLGQSLVKREA
jgi:hypothetical protein